MSKKGDAIGRSVIAHANDKGAGSRHHQDRHKKCDEPAQSTMERKAIGHHGKWVNDRLALVSKKHEAIGMKVAGHTAV